MTPRIVKVPDTAGRDYRRKTGKCMQVKPNGMVWCNLKAGHTGPHSWQRKDIGRG